MSPTLTPKSPPDPTSPTAPAASSAPNTPTIVSGTPVDTAAPIRRQLDRGTEPVRWYDRVEAFISKLSTRDNFWRSVCSLIWLPLAFFSGLKMKQLDADTFAAILPFRRFKPKLVPRHGRRGAAG